VQKRRKEEEEEREVKKRKTEEQERRQAEEQREEERARVEAETNETGLKALFEQHGLGSLRVDVCRELGVHSVDDLAYLTPEDLDALPLYLKDKLKAVQKRRLIAMFASQVSAAAPAPG